MNSTTSLPLPAHNNNAPSTAQMSENIFSKPQVPETVVVDVTTTVQAWLNDSQPSVVEDDLAATPGSPFEEELAFDRLSIGSIPDEEGPMDSPDLGSIRSQAPYSADTSIDEAEELVIVIYPGDSAIPIDIEHRRALLDSLIYWATTYVWYACKKPEKRLLGFLLSEVNNLHTIFHLNTEVAAEAMWLHHLLKRSKVFVDNCEEAFSESNPLRVNLGDNAFYVYAAYVISVYVVLERKGLQLNADCTIPLGLDDSLYGVVVELMDIAHELRNASRKSAPGVDICTRALTSILGWMEAREDEQKCHVHWILTAWYMKAALEHRHHGKKLIDQFFTLGGRSIHQAGSEEIALNEYKRLQADWVLFPSAVAESPITAGWVTKILEKYIVGEPLDVEKRLEWIHLNGRMSLVTCCFSIWVFGRLWEGTHLRKALAEEYGLGKPEEEVVQIYCMAARGATLVMDDADYTLVLRRILPKSTTWAQYERLQRAMLQDMDYRLFQVWQKPSEWLEVQWRRTTDLDECIQTSALVEAFRPLIDLVDGLPNPEEAVKEEADGKSKSDKEEADIIDV